MSNETHIILRHSQPSFLDQSSYGTVCKVMKDKEFDLYLQVNKHEEEDPKWIFIRTLDSEVQDDFIEHEVRNILGDK